MYSRSEFLRNLCFFLQKWTGKFGNNAGIWKDRVWAGAWVCPVDIPERTGRGIFTVQHILLCLNCLWNLQETGGCQICDFQQLWPSWRQSKARNFHDYKLTSNLGVVIITVNAFFCFKGRNFLENFWLWWEFRSYLSSSPVWPSVGAMVMCPGIGLYLTWSTFSRGSSYSLYSCSKMKWENN